MTENRRTDAARLNPRPFPNDTPQQCAARMVARYGFGMAWSVATSKKSDYDNAHRLALVEGDDPRAWRGYADFWHDAVISMEQSELNNQQVTA